MTNARIVLTTVGDKDSAGKLALQLVEQRLAACVNVVGPIRSTYRWRGQVHHDDAEFLLLIKTTAERAAHLRATLRSMHPYELPECVEIEIESGSDEYLAWIAAQANGGE